MDSAVKKKIDKKLKRNTDRNRRRMWSIKKQANSNPREKTRKTKAFPDHPVALETASGYVGDVTATASNISLESDLSSRSGIDSGGFHAATMRSNENEVPNLKSNSNCDNMKQKHSLEKLPKHPSHIAGLEKEKQAWNDLMPNDHDTFHDTGKMTTEVVCKENYDEIRNESDGIQINSASQMQDAYYLSPLHAEDEANDTEGDSMIIPSRNEITKRKFKHEAVDVEAFLQKHETVLRQRRAPCITPSSTKVSPSKRHCSPAFTRCSLDVERFLSKPERIRHLWNNYVEFLHQTDASFFCFEEAQMKEKEKVSRGKPAYAGLHVNRENNTDIDEVYLLFYKPKDDVGASSGAYNQFCCVIGQFLRFAIVCGVVDVDTVCEKGMTYEAFTHSSIVVAFLTYFDVRATVSTVLTKALHLKKGLFYAKMHFRRAQEADKAGRAEFCEQHVNAIFNARKRLCRQQASRRRAIENRVAQGTILFPQDFLGCISKARLGLDGIKKWFDETVQSYIQKGKSHGKARKRTSKEFGSTKGLMQKWCINFTALIILSAGGQRPQVFAQLLCPDVGSLESFVRLSSERGYCEVPTVAEKTVRNVNVPYVAFPKEATPYIVFHSRVVHPILMKLKNRQNGQPSRAQNYSKEIETGCVSGMSDESESFNEKGNIEKKKCGRQIHSDEEEVSARELASTQVSGFNGYLLLNTRNGHCLTTSQISNVFRHFLRHYDPEITGISTRDIRPSYATLMFRGWLSGEIHAEKNENEFLQHMAMMMNTSIEQLKSTYISIDRGDYDKTVKGMVTAFTEMIGSESREDQPVEDVWSQEHLDNLQTEEHNQNLRYFDDDDVNNAEYDTRKTVQQKLFTSKNLKLDVERPSSTIQRAALEMRERHRMNTEKNRMAYFS